jgi:hypothetical protein
VAGGAFTFESVLLLRATSETGTPSFSPNHAAALTSSVHAAAHGNVRNRIDQLAWD